MMLSAFNNYKRRTVCSTKPGEISEAKFQRSRIQSPAHCAHTVQPNI